MTSSASIQAYEKVYSRLTNAIRQRRALPTPSELADEIAGRNLGLKAAKFYASSVRHTLADDPLALSEFNKRWEDVRPLGGERRKKKLEITPETMAVIRRHGNARAGRSKYAQYVCDLIEGVILFGLRPVEWSEACWLNDEREVLVIRNGKQAEEILDRGPFAGRVWKRGNGYFRHLRLTGSEAEKEHARSLVERIFVHEEATPWAKSDRYLQRELKRIIERAIEAGKLHPRFRAMTIYNARHQFASTAKGSVSIEGGEVAALMGHISVKTAMQSYARRRKGNSWRLVVEASEQSIQAVENRSEKSFQPTQWTRQRLTPQQVNQPSPAPAVSELGPMHTR